jgi:hypothetical protein
VISREIGIVDAGIAVGVGAMATLMLRQDQLELVRLLAQQQIAQLCDLLATLDTGPLGRASGR